MPNLIFDDKIGNNYDDYKGLKQHAYLVVDAPYIPDWNLATGWDYYANSMQELFDFRDIDE